MAFQPSVTTGIIFAPVGTLAIVVINNLTHIEKTVKIEFFDWDSGNPIGILDQTLIIPAKSAIAASANIRAIVFYELRVAECVQNNLLNILPPHVVINSYVFDNASNTLQQGTVLNEQFTIVPNGGLQCD
jgi:hypothetical protein